MKMGLTDKIKEGIKEGFSSKAMRMHGSSYTIVGTMVALPLYLVASTMSAEQEAQDLLVGVTLLVFMLLWVLLCTELEDIAKIKWNDEKWKKE